jgi:xanthine dehydrogenase molybdopterin-binding subunit B
VAAALNEIYADRLGLEAETIRVVEGDTDKLSWGTGTGAARTATIAGTAVFKAVDKVINTIASFHCDEKATAWLNSFRGRIMEFYNMFIPRRDRQFLVDELDRGW